LVHLPPCTCIFNNNGSSSSSSSKECPGNLLLVLFCLLCGPAGSPAPSPGWPGCSRALPGY
jgi:hypothetical protein